MSRGYPKYCSNCKVEYSPEKWFKINGPNTSVNYCKSCDSDYMKKKRRTTRRLLIEGLGGKCACCDESREPFLTLHHKNNDGAEHRRRNYNGVSRGTNSDVIYREVIREGFPTDKYELRCYNCNCVLRNYPCCPHDFARIEASAYLLFDDECGL